MNKIMLALGMIGGSALTLMVMNKNVRCAAKKSIDTMFDEADKMFKD